MAQRVTPRAEARTAYERTMRPVVTEKQQVARSGARWFLPSGRGQERLRRFALALARVPFVDRCVTRAIVGKIAEIRGDGRGGIVAR